MNKNFKFIPLVCGHGMSVILVNSRKAYEKAMRAVGGEPDSVFATPGLDKPSAAAHSFRGEEGYWCSVVWLNPERRDNSLLEIVTDLGHEATHVWQYFERRMGHLGSDEVEAYCIDTITAELLMQWNPKLMKTKQQ